MRWWNIHIAVDRFTPYFLSHSLMSCIGNRRWRFKDSSELMEASLACENLAQICTHIFIFVVKMDSKSRLSLKYSMLSSPQNHLDVCPLFPVKCPNMCGKMEVPREKVSSFLKLGTKAALYEFRQTSWLAWFLKSQWSFLNYAFHCK